MITVYLLHFDRPYPRGRRPRHYVGVAADFAKRMREHETGSAKSRLMAAVESEDIGFTVTRTWEFNSAGEAFAHERKIKRRKQHSDFCPHCTTPSDLYPKS